VRFSSRLRYPSAPTSEVNQLASRNRDLCRQRRYFYVAFIEFDSFLNPVARCSVQNPQAGVHT
jgi:hypothetical protein